jgi:murein L,D-transpeptidase YafK
MDKKILLLAAASLILYIAMQSVKVQAAPKPESEATQDAAPQPDKIPAALVHFFTSQYYSAYVFLVDKKARELSVWDMQNGDPKKVASYPADLGKNDGEKKLNGDKKTPSGIYFLQKKLEGNSLDHKLYGDRAFTTNYPNFFDRAEGKSGSGIWFHAVPDTVPLTRGSSGCVVVRNSVINEVSRYIKLERTPIIIQDEMEWANSQDMKKLSEKATAMLEQWRSSWETKKIDDYIAFYDQDFKSQGMNVQKWRTFKTALNSTYKEINVRFSKPMIFAYKNYAIARFLQSYRSDQHEDFGEKLVYMVRRGESYKILGEEWKVENDDVARTELVSPVLNSKTTDPIESNAVTKSMPTGSTATN